MKSMHSQMIAIRRDVLERVKGFVAQMATRARNCERRARQRKQADRVSEWMHERERCEDLVTLLGKLLVPPLTVPTYRPQSECPKGLETEAAAGLRRLKKLLRDDQYTCVVNVCGQALDEMLVPEKTAPAKSFNRRVFGELCGVVKLASRRMA